MFVDTAEVTFLAGRGGDGCVSFRREKHVPRGGPNGGDGGRGGNIILRSRKHISSLLEFKFSRMVKAENGIPGSGSLKTGRDGRDRILDVPLGTVIKGLPHGKILYDFGGEEGEFIIARGGQGGRGNARFKSSTNQAPRKMTRGQNGEEINVLLELKLIAFAGLVGFPNAGKSTLISKITQARPKIADYPFTTLSPHLGVVYLGYESLVIADVPGIIEGAHKGDGMGLSFLKHIERNRILIYLIDVSPYAPKGAVATFEILTSELKRYQTRLVQKGKLVVANKIDLAEGENEELQAIENYCHREKLSFLKISALKNINLDQFKKKLFEFYHEG